MPTFSSAGRPSPLLWLFLGLQGRVSRQLYWLAFVFLQCVQAAIGFPILRSLQAGYLGLATGAGLVVLAASLYAIIAVSVKRLHDIGYSGGFSVAVVIPFMNLAFSIWVGIPPGTAGPNRYGVAPDRPPPA